MKYVAWIAAVSFVLVSFITVGAAEKESSDTKAATVEFESWYPKNIAPPKGTKYPCKLTALPKGLPGIPAEHEPFIDHAFSMILKTTHARLVIF
ncbi:MAG: hypothetical protein WBF93_07885 [Pirellulales bacterium]